MSPEHSNQERSEQATPKRLSEARSKGQVAKSMDLVAAIGFTGAVAVFAVTAGQFVNQSLHYMTESISQISQVRQFEGLHDSLFSSAVSNYVNMVWPIMATALFLGVAANLIQVGFLWSLDPIKPEFSRLDPISGLGKMFSTRALFDLVKAVLKLVLVGVAAYLGIRGEIDSLLLAGYSEGLGPMVLAGRVLRGVAIRVGLTYLVVGVADFLFQRYEYKKNMMMSKQEVKEEHKQMEGDPQIKARQRERQRLLATRRMFADIPKATVVITNPTHFAVALRYDQQGGAPVVVAKGCDYLAQRIKARARECGVPLFENQEVARSLYQQVEVGNEIPVELYRVVAEILATIFSRQGRL